MAALSRTERVSTCSATDPRHGSVSRGPGGIRPRVGFRPKRPQHEAGMRIEPAPSPPPAIGTIPAATAAAEPPLDPPGVRSSDHGFRHGPHSSGSVYGKRPNSGTLVLPRIETPVARTRRTNSVSLSTTRSLATRLPPEVGCPA